MRRINYDEMAKGYQEMAEINLTISQEFFHLEKEGESLYEMDFKETESKAE